MSLVHSPLVLVVLLSIIIGFLMVLVFRYTSDQKAIRAAKDRLKGHLLAVRLFQDQIQVVLISYWRIIRSTGTYLRLAFMPLLYVSVSLFLLMAQVDRYMRYRPLAAGQDFLVTAIAAPAALDQISLQLPAGVSLTAPPVHVPAQNEVVWRVVSQMAGTHELKLAAGDDAVS